MNHTRSPKLPNFLIVGAAKSGTTSLYHYLMEHPEVYMSDKIKETFYFIENKNKLGVWPDGTSVECLDNYNDYLGLFEDVDLKKHMAIGEACVAYLYFYEEAVRNIKKILGDPKIIIILRNPIDRTFSNYLHHVREGFEDCSFEIALNKQKERIDNNYWWGYDFISPGLYYKQVKYYLDNFSKVKIYLLDDLVNKEQEFVRNIFKFLEIDYNYSLKKKKLYNKTGSPKSKTFANKIKNPPIILKPFLKVIPYKYKNYIFHTLRDINLKKPRMKNETREFLKNVFKDDIKKLEGLINKDLSIWLK